MRLIIAVISAAIIIDVPKSLPSDIQFHFPLQIPADLDDFGGLGGEIKHQTGEFVGPGQ